MSPRTLPLSLALTASFIGVCAAVAADLGPLGPPIGTVRYDSEIRTESGEQDVDTFTATLLAGTRIKVTVKSAKKSALEPRMALLDAAGEEMPAGVRVAGRGRKSVLPTYEVTETGLLGIALWGDASSEGGYSAKFKVKPPKPLRIRKLVLDEAAGTSRLLEFPGVDGAKLDAVVKSSRKGQIVEILRVIEPDGGAAPFLLGALRRKGSKATITDLALSGGTGTYAVLVGVEEGEGTCSARIDVTPPDGPRGRVALTPDETFVVAEPSPLEARIGDALAIPTLRVVSPPAPRVLLGGVPATLVRVVGGGAQVEVTVPDSLTPDSLVSVAIIGGDGQASCRQDHLLVLPPEDDPDPDPDPVEVASILPPTASLQGEDVQGFQVALTHAAPAGGSVVALSATGGIGTVPTTLTVPQGSTAGFVALTAANVNATGQVVATLVGSVAADVTVTQKVVVDTPDTIDISGWTLVQANSSRTFTFPADTVLTEGDYVIVARNVSRSEFTTFWNVTLATEVHFFESTDVGATEWPSINGGETYRLDDDGAQLVDGTTIAMRSAAHRTYQRTPGTAAGAAASWTEGTDAVGTPTPGSGQSASGPANGVYISEFSDAPGAGNFPNEFVELYFDGNPEP